ncbi:MAG: M28 family metallopeptidase [bacterium]
MQRSLVWLVVATIAALVGLWRLPHLSQAYVGPTAWSGVPQFSALTAWGYAETLATQFPRRWSGSVDRQAAADWIASALRASGLEVHRSRFEAALGQDRPTVLENVWGISPGTDRAAEIIVALGNYDMASTSYQAASDTAGHVGTILELARVLHSAPHRRTFLFLFPDGEEWGMLGARHFAHTFPGRKSIVAALSIEDLDAGRIDALGLDGIGQFRGFTPMWLRTLGADAARREGLPVEDATPLSEWLQRSVLVSSTDQGPFLAAGIPAIDLAGRTADRVAQNRIYHLTGDTMDKMQPRSVEIYGRIQERVLRAIDAMPEAPNEPQEYLRTAPERIVTRPGLLAVQAVVFLPLLVSVLSRVRSETAPRSLLSESVGLGSVLMVMVGGLAVLKVLPRLGVMAVYALYPPPPRHPVLTEVNWAAVAVVFLAVGALAWLFWRIGRAVHRPAGEVDARGAVTVLRGWLLVLAVLALVDNAFGAVTFLLFPALLWIWIEPGPSTLRRLANAVLIAAGFVAFLALVVSYGQRLHLGGYVLWYLFMGAAYGQFTTLRLVMTLALFAIALRLLVNIGRTSLTTAQS